MSHKDTEGDLRVPTTVTRTEQQSTPPRGYVLRQIDHEAQRQQRLADKLESRKYGH